jgi:hypothetical protein
MVIRLPVDNVMFLLRTIASLRRVAQTFRENSVNPEVPDSDREDMIRLAESGEWLAANKEQVLVTLLGEEMIKLLSTNPAAQPGPEPGGPKWEFKKKQPTFSSEIEDPYA